MFRLPWPKNAATEEGSSLVDLLVSVGIIVIVFGMAFEAYQNALPSMRADGAMELLESRLRQAREVAIDQRRYVQVTFQGTSEFVATIVGLNGGANTQLYDYFLSNHMTYQLFSGIGDTPDGYGDSAAVTYNCPGSTLPCTITFNSDGSVQDGQSGSNNGSIFIGINGQTPTARALTILSATGKMKAWRYTGIAWR